MGKLQGRCVTCQEPWMATTTGGSTCSSWGQWGAFDPIAGEFVGVKSFRNDSCCFTSHPSLTTLSFSQCHLFIACTQCCWATWRNSSRRRLRRRLTPTPWRRCWKRGSNAFTVTHRWQSWRALDQKALKYAIKKDYMFKNIMNFIVAFRQSWRVLGFAALSEFFVSIFIQFKSANFGWSTPSSSRALWRFTCFCWRFVPADERTMLIQSVWWQLATRFSLRRLPFLLTDWFWLIASPASCCVTPRTVKEVLSHPAALGEGPSAGLENLEQVKNAWQKHVRSDQLPQENLARHANLKDILIAFCTLYIFSSGCLSMLSYHWGIRMISPLNVCLDFSTHCLLPSQGSRRNSTRPVRISSGLSGSVAGREGKLPKERKPNET